MTQRVGPYELQRLIGEGGGGRVWLARDTRLGRKVAMKSLHPGAGADEESIQRFRAEARNLAGLNHPNITTLLDIFSDGSSEWMIMELVAGQTLESLLTWSSRFSVTEALSMVAQVAVGLTYAHRMGLVHRDIKPSNLMVTEDGILKIMDFGIARASGSQRHTRAGQAVGTPVYLSPEQCRGAEGDVRSDQYSLAVVLYELLAGRPPFEAPNDFELMRAHLETRPASLQLKVRDIPKALDRTLQRALSKDPNQRFSSIEEFSREVGASAARSTAQEVLRGLLTDFQTSSQDTGETKSLAADTDQSSQAKLASTPKNRSPKISAASASMSVLAVLGVFAGFYWLFSSRSDPPSSAQVPAERADITGTLTDVISGNAVVVNAKVINLYGIQDTAISTQDVIKAKEALRKVLPKKVACYARPSHTHVCFGDDSDHQDLALLAMTNGFARADPGTPNNAYKIVARQ